MKVDSYYKILPGFKMTVAWADGEPIDWEDHTENFTATLHEIDEPLIVKIISVDSVYFVDMKVITGKNSIFNLKSPFDFDTISVKLSQLDLTDVGIQTPDKMIESKFDFKEFTSGDMSIMQDLF